MPEILQEPDPETAKLLTPKAESLNRCTLNLSKPLPAASEPRLSRPEEGAKKEQKCLLGLEGLGFRSLGCKA